MPGNSRRTGAVRKAGSKKPARSGSGGRHRKLAGKGPTPKAEDRVYHKAHQRKNQAEHKRATGRQLNKRLSTDPEVVIGRNSVLEALRASIPATQMYLMGRLESDDRIKEALHICGERGLQVLEAPKSELDRLSDGANHQGIALAIPPYEYADTEDLLDNAANAGEPLLAVLLDGITDARNLGAIIRSTAGFGGHGVIIPERRSAAMNAGAWKTSAGAAARIPVARVTNLTRTIRELQQAGVFVLGLDAGGEIDVPDITHGPDPVALVIGAEGKGLSRLVRETCDVVVSIPMAAATESLNAGVAAGVVLYEVARQRRGEKSRL